MMKTAFDETILRRDERAIFALRSLWSSYGYSCFKMSKFEEYELYAKNKEFLVSEGVITFNDTNGKLLALKPDVTLSILKNFRAQPGLVQRVYYNENVYRVSESSHSYKEILQTGLECLGAVGEAQVLQVMELAMKSLSLLGADFKLELSHIGLVSSLLDFYRFAPSVREELLAAIASKNAGRLKTLCSEEQFRVLKCLVKSYDSPEESLEALSAVCTNQAALDELRGVLRLAQKLGFSDRLVIDFSNLDTSGYYSGLVFRGYLKGIASRVLSGGRYDSLMEKMGRDGGAIGFAVYLDLLERIDQLVPEEKTVINIALPKGRLGEKVYAMFESAGFDCPSIRENNRKLIFENETLGIRFFWVKPSDVAIYVERGAADLGVAGKDILLEYAPNVYELLDLKVGKCRMAVAAKKDFSDDPSRTLRVATKFSNIAKSFYAEKCRDIDIIHLNGSIELAPMLGLSDVIVDIIETGKTLLENDLEPIEEIVPISARLIANQSSFQFKSARIEEIKKGLLKQVEQL